MKTTCYTHWYGQLKIHEQPPWGIELYWPNWVSSHLQFQYTTPAHLFCWGFLAIPPMEIVSPLVLSEMSLPMTRFAWWWQDLHAIELLRAHIGEWTITWMLDYWRVMCFTGYGLNWNPWIWIPLPVDLDCTLLCSQVDKTRYSSIASGNNCIVQLCKCVSLHL
jgi:hypothetical protein